MPPGGPGPGNGRSPMGYEAPSNIVQGVDGGDAEGYFYAVLQTWAYGAQVSGSAWQELHGGWNGSGNCFIRTRDLTDPASWRGWNGEDWNVSFVDPYNAGAGSYTPEDHVCTPVLNMGYPSIGCSTLYNKYIAVGSKIWDCSDIVFALSDDMVHWSEPYSLYQPECKGEPSFYQEIYPSLMDPASARHNFDTIGDKPYIYFATFENTIPSPDGGITVVRNIQRRPLQMKL